MSAQNRSVNTSKSKNKKKLDSTVQSKIDTLRELFPDWTSEDLVDIVQEFGDLETIIDKITSGAVTKWDEVKKPTKKERKEQNINSFASSSYNNYDSSNIISQDYESSLRTLPKPEDDWSPATGHTSSSSNAYNKKRSTNNNNSTHTGAGASHHHHNNNIADQRKKNSKAITLDKGAVGKTTGNLSKPVSHTTSWASAVASENSTHGNQSHNTAIREHHDDTQLPEDQEQDQEQAQDQEDDLDSNDKSIAQVETTAIPKNGNANLPSLSSGGTSIASSGTKKMSWAAIATPKTKAPAKSEASGATEPAP